MDEPDSPTGSGLLQPRTARPPIRLAAVLAAFLLGLSGAGCSSLSAKAIVGTSDGRPLTDATLTLRSPDPSRPPSVRMSGPNGCFNAFVNSSSPRPGLLVVEAPGYKALEWSLEPGREALLVITLVPLSAAGDGSARPVTEAERDPLYRMTCEPDYRGNAISLH